jgi:hypothetical protein
VRQYAVVVTGSDEANDSGGDSGPRRDAARRFWRPWQDDISLRLTRSVTIGLLLSPIGLLLISVARLLIVSDYNTVTAEAVVSSGGYVDTLLGTIIPVVPFALPYLALVLLFFNRVLLAALAVLATVCVSPVTIGRSAAGDLARKDWNEIQGASLIFVVLLAVVVAILLIAAMLGLGFGNFAKTVAPIACIALIPLVSQVYSFPVGKSFYVDLIRQPWLPAEMITLTSGQTIVGYILSDNGSSFTVLMDDNRAVYYYPDADVAKRQVCAIGQAGQMQPLILLLPAGFGTSPAEQCHSAPGYSPTASGLPRFRAPFTTDHRQMLRATAVVAGQSLAHE